MTFAAVRVAMARENFEDAPLTAEEQLMVAPPDVAAQDPEVAEAIQAEATDTLGQDTVQLMDDAAAVSEVAASIREAGDEVTPEAVLVAQERLAPIYARCGIQSRRFAREDFAEGNVSVSAQAQELAADAEKNAGLIVAAAAEGLRELGQRAAVSLQNLFKWRTTYIKDVRAVAKAAREVTGAPKEGAVYTNKVRIAHFTDGEQNVLTTAKQINAAFATSTESAEACRVLQEQMERVFVFFSKGSGELDLGALRKAFAKSTVTLNGREALSVTGKAAIFGEELVMIGLNADGVTTGQEDMLRRFADVRFSTIWHWRVGDLKDQALPPMAAKDVAANADALASLAAGLKYDYHLLDSLVDMFTASEMQLGGQLKNFITSPKLYLKYRNVVARTIQSMHVAGYMNADLKAKALNCLLDYYKWSLDNAA